jgi:catechol 2,3-dioxygenase-like lactoylglutathione lyase family enzyme
MDWKLELVTIPVSNVDRAKAFYVELVLLDCDRHRAHRLGTGLRASAARGR